MANRTSGFGSRGFSARQREGRAVSGGGSFGQDSSASNRARVEREVASKNKAAAERAAKTATVVEGLEETNFLQDLLGISKALDYNPDTANYEPRFTKTVSPTSIALGLTGPAGMLAAAFAKQAGVDDPLSFDVDLGFLSDETKPKEKKDRSGSDDKKEKLQFAQNDQLAPDAAATEELPFGDKVAQIMEQTQFEFGAMPDFNLLNNVFGTDLAALVDKTKKA